MAKCGRKFDDLSGRQFGIWKVLDYDRTEWYGQNQMHGMTWYRCKCKKCGVVVSISRSQLTQEKNMMHRGCKEAK